MPKERPNCDNCIEKPANIHDNEYNEWFCRKCWDEFSVEEQGSNWSEIYPSK